MKKRILSLLLVFVMAFSLLPAGAFATEEWVETAETFEELTPEVSEVIDEIPEEIPEEIVIISETPEEMVEEVPEELPEEIVEETPEEIVEELPEEIVEETPEEIVEETPKEIVEELPEELPEENPEDLGSIFLEEENLLPEEVFEEFAEELNADGGDAYKLVSSVTAGREYIISNVNSGNGYALANNDKTVSKVDVSVQTGDVDGDSTADTYISSSDSSIVMTAVSDNGGFKFTNDGNSLHYDSSLRFSGSSATTWIYENSQMKAGERYLYYSNSSNKFNASSSHSSDYVYIYEKVSSDTPGEQGEEPAEPTGKSISVEATKTTATERTATIAVGETLTISVTHGSGESKSFTNTVSDDTVAEITSGARISSLAKGVQGTVTVKGLINGTTDITLTGTGSGSKYVAIIHLTVGEGGQGEPQPSGKSVDVTPEHSKEVAEKLTLDVDEEATIKIKNGSDRSGYTFTLTVDDGEVANIYKASVEVAAGGTAEVTVKGLKDGTAVISITNNQQQGARKATITVTVGTGESGQEEPQPSGDVTFVKATSIEDGKEYLFVGKSGSGNNGYALANGTEPTGKDTDNGQKQTITLDDTITLSAEKAKTVTWKAAGSGSSFSFVCDGKYLSKANNTSVEMANAAETFTVSGTQIKSGSNTLSYGSNSVDSTYIFNFNTAASSAVTVYVKDGGTTPVTPPVTDGRYIGFTSDVHGDTGNLEKWFKKLPVALTNMAFCGDYSYSYSQSSYKADYNTIVGLTNTYIGQDRGIFTTGNHEWQNSGASLSDYPGIIRLGEASNVFGSYRVFCLGASSFDEGIGRFQDSDISVLKSYLAGVPATTPVFILSHYPLHYISSRTISNAENVIDVLNNYPNAVFLWGHNHSQGGETHYGEVKSYGDSIQYTSSKSKNINFIYACAGAMNNSQGTNDGLVVSVDGTALTFTFYNEDGSASGRGTIQLQVADPTATYYTVTASATGNGTVSPESASVKEGQSKEFTFTPNSPKYKVGAVKLDGVSDVTSDVSGNKYTLTNVTKEHFISVTFVEDPDYHGPDLELTPDSSDSPPSADLKINMGESFTVQLTNGSSNSDYDFTVTFSKAGVASADKNSLNIARNGGTGLFTITGLKDGKTTVTFSNNNSGYARVATVNLTVGDGIPEDVVVPVAGKSYVILFNDGYALTTDKGTDYNNSNQYYYTGLAGKLYSADTVTNNMVFEVEAVSGNSFYLKNGTKYLNGAYVSNSSNGYNGSLTLGEKNDTWTLTEDGLLKSMNASAGHTTGDKYLARGNKSADQDINTFSVRSEENSGSVSFIEAKAIGPEQPEEPEVTSKEDFVKRMYSVCLGRDASQAEIEYYLWEISDNGMTGSEVANKFIFDDEFCMKNYCDKHYVEALYKAFMGREPAQDEIESWVWRLQQGDRREDIFNEFVVSAEFKGLCTDAGIVPGDKIICTGTGTKPGGYCSVEGCTSHTKIVEFATRLYDVCLDRKPAQDEIDAWHYNFVHGDYTGTTAAQYFVFGPEFTGHNYSDKEFSEHLYSALMGRSPSDDELEYWIWNLGENGTSREAAFTEFVKSDEFAVICQEYGVIV